MNFTAKKVIRSGEEERVFIPRMGIVLCLKFSDNMQTSQSMDK